MKRTFIPVLIAFALSSCSDETDLEEDSMNVSDLETAKSETRKPENVAVHAAHKAPPKRQETKKEKAKRDVFSIKSVLGKRKNKQKHSKLSRKERKIQLEYVRKAREEAKERRQKPRASSGVNPYAKHTYR